MTPKVSGIASAMAKLKHGFDDRADKLLTRISEADRLGSAAFSKANEQLDAAEASIQDVENVLAELQGNGGPTMAG